MTYNDTMAIVYRVLNAYPFYARNLTNQAVEGMIREWHEGLANIDREGAMEAVTAIISEQKWMPSLSEVLGRILDIQYGSDESIIGQLDRAIRKSSNCIIFGQVTDEQREGYEKLTPFQKLIIHSPSEFNLWLNKDYEWKEERVKQVKREVRYGKHNDALEGKSPAHVSFNVFKALEERKNGQDQQP